MSKILCISKPKVILIYAKTTPDFIEIDTITSITLILAIIAQPNKSYYLQLLLYNTILDLLSFSSFVAIITIYLRLHLQT